MSYTGITSAFQADERGPIPLTRSLKMKSPFMGDFVLNYEIIRGIGPAGAATGGEARSEATQQN